MHPNSSSGELSWGWQRSVGKAFTRDKPPFKTSLLLKMKLLNIGCVQLVFEVDFPIFNKYFCRALYITILI